MCFNEHDDETCYDDGIVDNNRDAVRHAFTVMLRLAMATRCASTTVDDACFDGRCPSAVL